MITGVVSLVRLSGSLVIAIAATTSWIVSSLAVESLTALPAASVEVAVTE